MCTGSDANNNLSRRDKEMDQTFFTEQARKLRRLARSIVDEHAKRELMEMADEYDARAAKLATSSNRIGIVAVGLPRRSDPGLRNEIKLSNLSRMHGRYDKWTRL
jgi:hypothetical protein